METIIQKALKILLDKYGAQYDCVTILEESGHYRANIETPEPARLIGRNGAILSALQLVLKNILWSQNEEKAFVTFEEKHKNLNTESIITILTTIIT
jgi:predicted RNA-binding protein Jag